MPCKVIARIFPGFPMVSQQIILVSAVLGGTAIAAALYFYNTSPKGNKTRKKLVGIPGLQNLGNTCYANALLQGLSSLPSIVNWLRTIDTSKYNLSGGFVSELKDIVLKLNDGSATVYNAGGVTSALAMHKWNIILGVEHDLYELFNVFVTTWEEELQFFRRQLLDSSLLELGKISSFNSSSASFQQTQMRTDTFVEPLTVISRKQLAFKRCAEAFRIDARLRAPCFGLTATELRCCQSSCGYKKIRYDTFGVISLSIPKAFMGMHMTLESLLRKYFCMEMIRDATCDRCKKTNGKSDGGLFKKQGFSKLPQSLIIRIERVGVLPSGTIFKLSDHVEFGETLDVRDLCFYRNRESDYDMSKSRHSCSSFADCRYPESTSRIVGGAEINNRLMWRPNGTGFGQKYSIIDGGSFMAERRESARFKYQLRAVSEHRGIPQTGHFATYRRGLSDAPHAWYLTNDSHIKRVPYSQVASAQAYMLYYERIQPSRWYKQSNFTLGVGN